MLKENMKKKMRFGFLKKVSFSTAVLLSNSAVAFAAKEKERDLLQQFYDQNKDVFVPLMLIFAFCSVVSVGIGLVMNKKNPEKREEEMNGMIYLGFGLFIIFSAMTIVRAYSI